MHSQRLTDTRIQRVEAEPQREETEAVAQVSLKGERWLDAGDFAAGIDVAPAAARVLLRKLSDRAIALEQGRLVKLSTFHEKAGILTLLPRLPTDDAGLVSIYNNNGSVYLQFWRSVFERRTPSALARIEASIMPIKQGNITREVSDELLEELTTAYKEANSRTINIEEIGE